MTGQYIAVHTRGAAVLADSQRLRSEPVHRLAA